MWWLGIAEEQKRHAIGALMTGRNTNLNLARIVHRILINPKGWEVGDLQRQLGIKPRAYRNYRKRLQDDFVAFQDQDGESAIREVKEGDQRYLRLVQMPATENHTQEFTSRVAALHFAQLLLGFVDNTPVHDAMRTLLDDFKDGLADRSFTLSHVLRNTDRIFYQLPDAPKDYTQKGDVIQTLTHALIFTKKIRVVYGSVNFDPFEIDLQPYTLAVYRSALYLIAKSDAHDDVRIWAVDRIESATELQQKFDYPSRGQYSPDDYTDGSFGIYRTDSPDVTKFELIFADERWLKLYITERKWHPSQRFKHLKDGRLRMTFSVNTEVEVWRWIRSFGDDVTVVKPSRPT